MSRSLIVASVVAFVLFASASHAAAAPLDTTRTVRHEHVNVLLNASLERLTEKIQDFNQHVSAINKLRPFDLESLDSSHIENTIGEVLGFTEFLKGYLATTDSMRLALIDSLYVLRTEDPNPDVQRSIAAFEKSYKTDQVAFRAYVESLQRVYQNVLDALLFVKSSKYTIGKNGLQFAGPVEVKRYEEFMSKIDKLTTDLQKTSVASRKATDEANRQLKALNTVHAQEAAQVGKKRGKK